MKRLLLTCTDLMAIQFMVPHVRYLAEKGYAVELACSDVGGRMEELQKAVGDVAKLHTVRLVRSPFSPGNRKGYQDLKNLLLENRYDVIWTNEPVMGVMTRLAARKARKAGTKVVYMAHGFHFYKGAGKAGWLIYYPVERFMSRFCDVLVTINHEDETRAKAMHAPRVEYIHGIGVNTERLHCHSDRSDVRRELGLQAEDFLVLSVGELNENKNHQVVLRSLAKLDDTRMHYVICGKGSLREQLEDLAKKLGIEQRVHFLGYRKDVVDICAQADVFAFPSRREGLGLAPLEAMYCGLPLIASNIRGVQDYAENGESGFLCDPDDAEGIAQALKTLKEDGKLRARCAAHNKEAVLPFCLEPVKQEVLQLLESI